MQLRQRTKGESRAYFEGFNLAIELAARRFETANDETSNICIIAAIRAMKHDFSVALGQSGDSK